MKSYTAYQIALNYLQLILGINKTATWMELYSTYASVRNQLSPFLFNGQILLPRNRWMLLINSLTLWKIMNTFCVFAQFVQIVPLFVVRCCSFVSYCCSLCVLLFILWFIVALSMFHWCSFCVLMLLILCHCCSLLSHCCSFILCLIVIHSVLP